MIEKNIVELEEMDWKNTERIAIDEIRKNLIQLELNHDILAKSRLRLKEMHDALPTEEKEKRERLESENLST